MEDRIYHIRISPEVIKNKIFPVIWTGGTIFDEPIDDECCDIITTTTTQRITGTTYVYSSMTSILSGGTNGESILTGLTIPIFLTENTIDIGYYSVFDGAVLQQDTMTNFLFSANTTSPNRYYVTNTSDVEFKKYLSFSNYKIDWGDGTIQTITSTSPNFYFHDYASSGEYTISMSGMSPWGANLIKKDIVVPYTDVTILNPNGTAYFYASGGNWANTPISYDFIFTGDSYCDIEGQVSSNYITIPFLVTGYTKSSLKDIEQYGLTPYPIGVTVTGNTGVIGVYNGTDAGNNFSAYTINNIDYYDFKDGTTIFAVYSSGITEDSITCSAITKNEALLNVIDQPEIYSNVFIERGKISALESVQRLGEVDNVGDIVKYGYKFFNIIKT